MLTSSELSKIWKAHAASLVLLVRGRCVNPEDCVQEAFVRLATQSPVPDEPVAWLVRVVRNEAISQSRSESRRRRREESASRPAWLEPAEVAINDVSADEVCRALEQLPSEQQELIIARIWNGLTFRQLAEVFGMSRAGAHRKYDAALGHLRERLECPAGTEGMTHET